MKEVTSFRWYMEKNILLHIRVLLADNEGGGS